MSVSMLQEHDVAYDFSTMSSQLRHRAIARIEHDAFNKVYEEIDPIMVDLFRTADKGEFEVTHRGKLSAQSIEHLSLMGYNIVFNSDTTEPEYRIKF